MVNVTPFRVILKKLTSEEIQYYMKTQPKAQKAQRDNQPTMRQVSIQLHKLPLSANQSGTVAPPNLKPKDTKRTKGFTKPKRQISGYPSAVKSVQQQHTFHVQRHVLLMKKG